MSGVDEYRKGRNLAILSFVIIVYTLSGAEIAERGPLGGVMLEFEKPEMLEYAFMGFFAFSLHQFFIAVGNPLSRFLWISSELMWTDPKLRSHINRRAQKCLEEALKEGACGALLGMSDEEIETRGPTKAQWKKSHQDRGRITQKRKWFSLSALASAQDSRSSAISEFPVRVGWWRYSMTEAKVYLKIFISREEAWHDLFPLILAACAIISVSVSVVV